MEDIRKRWQTVQELRTSGEPYEGALLALADDLSTYMHRVEELHKVIAGNVEHSIAAWLDKKADLLADQYADAHVPQGHIAWETIKIIQALAHGVENGAWKA